MIPMIKNITDKTQFNQILNENFINNFVFFKSDTGNIQVELLNCSGGLATVRMPFRTDPPEKSLMFARREGNIYLAHLKFQEARNEETFVFYPEKLQVMTAERKGGRKILPVSDEKKRLIYMTDIITDHQIKDSLLNNRDKLDKIRERMAYDNKYEYMRLFFADSDIADHRMNYFYDKRTFLFIPNYKSSSTENGSNEINFYLKKILPADSELAKRRDLKSEVSVPFLHNGMIPFGYIQVNNSNPLTPGVIPGVSRIASVVERMVEDYRMFVLLNDRLLVSDVSPEGLGIVFKEKKYIPLFKENLHVSFDIILPNNKKASIFAVARHLDIMEDKFIKAGFEIIGIDKYGVSNYEGFLKSIDS